MAGCDFLIVGGGIVGLTTAYTLMQRCTEAKIVLIEKESQVAQHQTGRNSGVIHSGIYYKPGSLKATTCKQGRQMMIDFCQQHELPFEICGKVIVAVDESELPALERIHERGLANGIGCQPLSRQELQEIEPHASGVRALHVRDAGIISYTRVSQHLERMLVQSGNMVRLKSEVVAIRPQPSEVEVVTRDGTCWNTKYLITCGGLQSDRLVQLSGLQPAAQIVPFRGEYYELKPESRELCRHLIYPVPDSNFPFLGVHLTRMIDGEVECGPNAVLALKREGYRWGQVNVKDLFQSLRYVGFQKLATKHWKSGMGEIHRSLSKRAFTRALQRLVPAIQATDLKRGRAGVRAQALLPDGTMVDDFLWVESDRMTHVCNAPSPAATASLAIADTIVQHVLQQHSTKNA